MTTQIVFSVLFFIAFIAYVQVVIHIFPYRKSAPINRLVIVIGLAMAIWSLGFSVANSAKDYEAALLWRRISSIGWGMIFTLLLHFTLTILVKPEKVLKKWLYVLIYLPGIITVVLFGLHPSIARGQYNLIYTSTGWLNQSMNNGIDWFFYSYFISYTLISLSVMLYVRLKSNENRKNISRLMLSTIFISFIITTITDVLFNVFFAGDMPQIAPIILLVPILSIYRSIKKNKIITMTKEDYSHIEGSILNGVTHSKLYRGMGMIYIYGGYAAFVSLYYLDGLDLSFALMISGSFIMVGLVIHSINRTRMNSNSKDVIIASITSITILIFQLNYMDMAGVTTWITPVILIVFSILINNRLILIMNSVAALISIIIVGIKVPHSEVLIGSADHFIRLFLLIIVVLLANTINHIFIKRLKENENQIKHQKLIAHISTEFSTVNKDNVHNKFIEALQLYAKDFLVDRSYVYLLSEDQSRAKCMYEYGSNGNVVYHKDSEEIELSEIPWWLNEIRQCHIINIPELSILPTEAVLEMKKMIEKPVKSILLIPLTDDGQLIGVMGFDMFESKCQWSETAVNVADIIGKQFTDALRKIKSTEAIESLAYYDALTGLPNRILFNNRLEKELERSKRTKAQIGVLFVDLDSFKTINDTLGHETGDELLKSVADKLSKSIRSHDTVSRFGGDEFLIMLNDIKHTDDLVSVAEAIMSLFDEPTYIKEHEFFVTASIGIAVYPNDGRTISELIKNADMAMYASKDLGKNCYSFSSSLLKADVLKKSRLTNGLYKALERNELELYYQPQVTTNTGKIVGLEALLRWHHPEDGMIPPLDFIYIAEQTGLIIPIGEWVIRTACKQNMAWQELGFNPMRMAVNLSVVQFRSDDLVNTVEDILIETGMDAKYLELEITESIATKGTKHIIDVLTKLKALGLSISIDDFGTEYSSLSRIKMMPIDRIKMDMNFVQSISKSSKDDAIVRIIIQLAQSLELKVIAEGVETEPQLDFLTKQACDEIQGYYYYKPMKASELTAILASEFAE